MPATSHLHIRIAPENRATLAAAAQAAGVTLSDFVISAALDQARTALADQTVFALSATDFATVAAQIEANTEPTPELAALMKTPPVWKR